MATGYFLLKSEPSTYSFSDLERDGKTHWNGVRNPQARNFLREAKRGDLAFIYHSGDDKAVIGVAEITSDPYPDPDPKKPGEWVQFEVKPKARLKRPIPLSEIRGVKELAGLPLLKQSRLSSMKVTKAEFETIRKLADRK